MERTNEMTEDINERKEIAVQLSDLEDDLPAEQTASAELEEQ